MKRLIIGLIGVFFWIIATAACSAATVNTTVQSTVHQSMTSQFTITVPVKLINIPVALGPLKIIMALSDHAHNPVYTNPETVFIIQPPAVTTKTYNGQPVYDFQKNVVFSFNVKPSQKPQDVDSANVWIVVANNEGGPAITFKMGEALDPSTTPVWAITLTNINPPSAP